MQTTKETEFNKELGRLIRAAREMVGMTQKQVAKKIGVTFQQIQKYEVGDNGMSVYRLYQLSGALDTSFAACVPAVANVAPSDYRILDKTRMETLLAAARGALDDIERELLKS